MKARIIALCILVVIILIPIGLYWYFYTSKITTLIFENADTMPYRVSLEGTLQYEYFPLLDTVFSYEKDCINECVFSPIPPLQYSLKITGSGRVDTIDTLTLKTGIQTKYTVDLIPNISFVPVGKYNPFVVSEGFLGLNQQGEGVSLRSQNLSERGVYIGKGGNPIFTLSFPIRNARVDMSRMFALFDSAKKEQYIYSLDGRKKVTFPFPDAIKMVMYDTDWKVMTDTGVYEKRGNDWKINSRFTDYINISSRYRIGYIDRRDSEKLLFQNLKEGESVFVLLDRTNAESHVIERGRDVEGFLIYEGKPSILQADGSISNIMIDLSR